MKTKTKHFFKTAITIPMLLLMMLLSFSVHSQTHVYNETTASGIFTDPDGALVANPLSDAFNSSANCARAATGGFGKIQIFPTYTPGATDRLYFSVYNPGNASFAQVKFEYTGAPGVWEDGGDVYYGSASTTGWVEYSIGLAPNEGNTINKIILMPSGSSSVAVYVDNIYFHTTSLYPSSGATHFFKDVVENGSIFHSGAGIFNNPLPADPVNSTVKCLRTNGTGAWRETQIFNVRYVVKTGNKLFISFYNPNNATQWQLRFLFRDGDYLGPADIAHVSGASSGWSEVSVDLTPYIGKEIEKISLFAAHSELKQVYSDNIYIGSASVIPQQPLVYNETISSGIFIDGDGAQVANPVSDVVNSSANCARSGTGGWKKIEFFPTYTAVSGSKLYFSVHNPNNAGPSQVKFEYSSAPGTEQWGGNVTYISGSTTGWREYSIDLTSHVGNTISKILMYPSGGSSAATYIDNVYFGTASIVPPAPQEPIVYNETISSGIFIDGDGAQVANPVSDVVNPSANCARSGTGGWKKIEFFPTYTAVSGSKLYFSVHNPNNAGPGQVKFEYSSAPGTEQWGDNVTYVSGSTTGWREYSIDLTAHLGNTITKILMYPSGGSSAATYIDNVYFGTTSTTPAPEQPLVYNETISSGMFIDGDGAQVANPVSDVVNPSANCAKSGTGGWKKIEYFPTYTPVSGSKLYFSVYNPNNAGPGQVQFEYTSGGGWQWGGNVTYVSGSLTGWREYSIDLTSHVGNTINKIIIFPAGGSSAATYIDNVYFGTASIVPPAPQEPIVYNETISSGIFIDGDGAQVANPVSDAVNSSANCARSGTGGWKKIEFFPTYTAVSGSKLYFSVHNPNGAGPAQVKFEYSSAPGTEQWGDNVTYVSGSVTGWKEYSIDLTSHVGNTITKILMYPSGGSSGATYIDNVYFGTASILPQEPIVYNETISSGMFIDGDGSQVANPVFSALNTSANCARSGTGGWKKIEYFPTYTPVSGSKLYFSVYNPNNAGPGQVQFEYTSGGGWQWGGNVDYISSSVTGWVEYSIDLSSHIGNTINKIIMFPAGGSSTAAYIDNVYFGSASILTETNTPIVANTGICKGTVGATPSATPFTGYTLVWYKDATTTTALPATPVITATKTYYVAQRLGAGAISPRVPVTTTVNDLPTTPSPVVLTEGATVIKKVGNFIGTSTALTLTATAAGTVPTDHYNWTLPTDVAQVSGGNTGVITVNFAAVAPGNTALDFFVSSVSAAGCASKTAKKLTVTRALPSKPKALTLTDALLPEVLKITKLGAYTGALKTRTLTLTATPETKAGSQATSYKWVLPAGVTTTASTTATPNTYTSTAPSITITLAGVTTETTFLFQVYGVNGNGESALSKDLTCTSAAPKTPAIVASPSTTFNVCSTRTYTTTDQLGATFNWTVPAGASIVGASTGNVIVVDFSGVTTASSYAVTCSASNGLTSVVKSLTIKRAATCAKIAPEDVVAEDNFSAIAYPNPSSDEFTIESSRKGANVKVYDMVGRLIENRQATATSVQVGRNYATGIYNVIVSQGGRAKTLKVIKR